MCIVSNIGNDWNRTFPDRYPNVPLQPIFPIPEISRTEFEKLKAEVLELKELLKAAKKFDEATGQPDCEQESKIKFMKQIAEALGLSMDDVFQEPK